MIETLTKARDLIQERGLAHGRYVCSATGELCTVGAVIEALGLNPQKDFDDAQLRPIISEMATTIDQWHWVGDRGKVFTFNDTHTKDEVVQMLDTTIERLTT